jgi:hypothetical protein
MTKAGAGENRNETEILSNKYMIKKLKMFSMAALATVAAVSTAQAATPTNVTVLNKVGVMLTAYSADTYVTNKAGTEITAKTTPSAFTMKSLLAAINVATGSSIDTNKASLGYTNTYVLTNGYIVAYTNNGKGTYSTNAVYGTNYAGLTNLATTGLTIASNMVYARVAGGWATVVGTTISPTSTNLPNYFEAYAGAYGAGNGNEKAFDGVPLLNSRAGTAVISEGYLDLFGTTNTWSLYVSGYGGSSSSSVMNLGTEKAPVYIETSNANVPVYGSGTDISATATNNYTFKGTLTDTFWKIIK